MTIVTVRGEVVAVQVPASMLEELLRGRNFLLPQNPLFDLREGWDGGLKD